MVKKFTLIFLCTLIFLKTEAAQPLDPYENSDICLSAAQTLEAKEDVIIQCLEGASLETLDKMQKHASPLWGLGNYVLRHPHLKSHYDSRIAAYCETPSLEIQAFIIQSPLRSYITGHSDFNFDQSVVQTIKKLSFDDFVALCSLDNYLNLNRTASTIYEYARTHPELKIYYGQRSSDILKGLSLEQWAKLQLPNAVYSAPSGDALLHALIQNLSLAELLHLNRKDSPFKELGGDIRGYRNLKRLHDKRLAEVLPTLSFETWKELPSCLVDFCVDLIENHTLKAAYDAGVMNLIPSLSFEQIKELHKYRWAYGETWYLSSGVLDVRKAYNQHLVAVLQGLSLEDLASVKGEHNLEIYMNDEEIDSGQDLSLKTIKAIYHKILAHALNQSSYEKIIPLKEKNDSFGKFITTHSIFRPLHDRLKTTWLSQLLETSTEWLMLYQEILSIKDRTSLLCSLQDKVAGAIGCTLHPTLTLKTHLENPEEQMDMGCLYSALAHHHPSLKSLLSYAEVLNGNDETKLDAIILSPYEKGRDVYPHWNAWTGMETQGYYSRWDKDIYIKGVVYIPTLIQQLTHYVTDKMFNNVSIPSLDKEAEEIYEQLKAIELNPA